MRWIAIMVLCSGCLGTSPDERLREQIGDGEDEGPEHNPGEPCLACHRAEYSPGEDVFVIAGTIYLEQDDTVGIRGARVEIVDALGRRIEAITNRAGNFMVEADLVDDDGTRIDAEDGKTTIDFEPEFPLQTTVTYEDLEEEMVTAIHREGSCSACHYREPGADSVGRIYLVEPP